LSADPEVRSVQIGVIGTIFVHLLLFFTVPALMRMEPHGGLIPPAREPAPFDIELAPDAFPQPQPEPPPPFKFVETNPDAPDNIPDSTENFGAQNQQTAQEKESPDMTGNRAAIEGQTEIQSERIVSGQLAPPEPPVPSSPPQAETPPQQEANPVIREQIPLTGFEKATSETENSYGSNVAKVAEGTANADQYVEGVKDAPLVQNASSTVKRIDPNQPQPRPKLEKRARPAIFTENKIGTKNIGPTAVDARWSNYGQYLQQLIETVQTQWDRILLQSRVYPGSGTKATVKFILNSKGEISRIISVDGTAGELGLQNCVSAITDRAPFGDWSDDMITMLGEEQEMTFTFFYQ